MIKTCYEKQNNNQMKIDEEQIKEILDKLHNKKACGRDFNLVTTQPADIQLDLEAM